VQVTVIEIKLILNDDIPDHCLSDLKDQILNARQLLPGSKVLGVTFVAAAPLITPGTFDKKVLQVETCIAATFPDEEGFRWVSNQHFRKAFAAVESEFAYPAMSVSLSIGILELVAHTPSPR